MKIILIIIIIIIKSHTTFKLRRDTVSTFSLCKKITPSTTNIFYLGFILDKRLTWAEHDKQKILILTASRESLHHFIGEFTLKNKLNYHKTNLISIDSTQFWGATKISNIFKILYFQSISLLIITPKHPSTSQIIL